jgi:hypothetical protein
MFDLGFFNRIQIFTNGPAPSILIVGRLELPPCITIAGFRALNDFEDLRLQTNEELFLV